MLSATPCMMEEGQLPFGRSLIGDEKEPAWTIGAVRERDRARLHVAGNGRGTRRPDHP